MELFRSLKDIAFKNNVSEPIVMRSNAGWYIGTIYNDDGLIMPNQRLTGYMSKDDAIAYLDTTPEVNALPRLITPNMDERLIGFPCPYDEPLHHHHDGCPACDG